AYFRDLAAEEVRPGDRLILCTAKPSWVHAGMIGDESYTAGLTAQRNLEYFERTVIDPSGARALLTLSGDLHHYARYANQDGARMKITAGGGGAYLYPTHGLPQRISWLGGDGTEEYTLRATHPSPERSPTPGDGAGWRLAWSTGWARWPSRCWWRGGPPGSIWMGRPSCASCLPEWPSSGDWRRDCSWACTCSPPTPCSAGIPTTASPPS